MPERAELASFLQAADHHPLSAPPTPVRSPSSLCRCVPPHTCTPARVQSSKPPLPALPLLAAMSPVVLASPQLPASHASEQDSASGTPTALAEERARRQALEWRVSELQRSLSTAQAELVELQVCGQCWGATAGEATIDRLSRARIPQLR
jgi:hypothetical protein